MKNLKSVQLTICSILFVVLLFTGKLNAQDFSYINSKSSGFLIGTSYVDEHLPGGSNYHPIKLIYNYSIPLLKNDVCRKSNLFLQFEPQFNPVIVTNSKNAFEFGVNIGFLYHLSLNDKSMFFGGIGSGPHYISVETSLQANGFIFSDNFIIGYRQLINTKNSIEFNIQTRFRHISNAGIKEPNLGIDNFFLLIGIFKIIVQR